MRPAILTVKIFNEKNAIDSFVSSEELSDQQKALITYISQVAVREYINAQKEIKHIPQQEKIIRIKEVMQLTALSRSSIYTYINKGKFPSPIKLGVRSVGWKFSQIEAWINSNSIS